MSLFLTFITSLMLGMRHATDPDHIVAVTTIVSRERSVAKAAWIGAVWGVGHTITLLLVGGALAFFAHFLAPTILRTPLKKKTHDALFTIGLAIVAYGIILTVVPGIWTPFNAHFTMPKIGWTGVFSVAIVFDLAAAFLAFFVLRRMKVPSTTEVHAEAAPAPHGVIPAMKG